jgi:hypothetical protein
VLCAASPYLGPTAHHHIRVVQPPAALGTALIRPSQLNPCLGPEPKCSAFHSMNRSSSGVILGADMPCAVFLPTPVANLEVDMFHTTSPHRPGVDPEDNLPHPTSLTGPCAVPDDTAPHSISLPSVGTNPDHDAP